MLWMANLFIIFVASISELFERGVEGAAYTSTSIFNPHGPSNIWSRNCIKMSQKTMSFWGLLVFPGFLLPGWFFFTFICHSRAAQSCPGRGKINFDAARQRRSFTCSRRIDHNNADWRSLHQKPRTVWSARVVHRDQRQQDGKINRNHRKKGMLAKIPSWVVFFVFEKTVCFFLRNCHPCFFLPFFINGKNLTSIKFHKSIGSSNCSPSKQKHCGMVKIFQF